MSERMLLFIPAYNCEKQITRVLDQLDKRVFAYFEEALVVNNRSTDGTEQVVLVLQSNCVKWALLRIE